MKTRTRIVYGVLVVLFLGTPGATLRAVDQRECEDNWAGLGGRHSRSVRISDYSLDRNPSGIVVSIPMLGNPDWSPYYGKRVAVAFSPNDHVDQVVLHPSDVNLATRRAIDSLLSHTHEGWPIRLFAVEVGMWMVVTERRAYHSKIFGSGERNSLNLFRDGVGPMGNMLGRVERFSQTNESPRELVLFHTHPGRGDALNRVDIAAIRREAARAFERFPSLEAVTIYAVPIKNRGQLLFRHRIFRPTQPEE